MERPIRVLVMEDSPKWQEQLHQILTRAGYHVDVVGSAAGVWEKIATSFYHILSLDINIKPMPDADDDEQDTGTLNDEGMQVLRQLFQERYIVDHTSPDETGDSAFRIVMLSGPATMEQMREAAFDFVVRDFIRKAAFSRKGYLESVRRVAATIGINLNLVIHWGDTIGPEEMVKRIRIKPLYSSRTAEFDALLALELEDLLCRLFHSAESISLEPLEPGHSGSIVFLVTPVLADRSVGRPVVVKIGRESQLSDERHNFETCVRPYKTAGYSTNLEENRRTIRLEGISYSFIGTNDPSTHFGEYYQNASYEELVVFTDNLFQHVLGGWYANPGEPVETDILAEYQASLSFGLEELIQSLSSLSVTRENYSLRFEHLAPIERSFVDPIPMLSQEWIYSIYRCITHGDLHHHNILVDRNNPYSAWLIDFRRTGKAHILRDVAQLETSVRLQLLTEDQATLFERFEMETYLTSGNRYGDYKDAPSLDVTENAFLNKAVKYCLYLRRKAQEIVQAGDDAPMGDYFAALYFNNLNIVRFVDKPVTLREHALLSTSLIVEKGCFKV